MWLEMKVDAARHHQARAGVRRAKRQRERGHRHRMRIVRVQDLRVPLPEDP